MKLVRTERSLDYKKQHWLIYCIFKSWCITVCCYLISEVIQGRYCIFVIILNCNTQVYCIIIRIELSCILGLVCLRPVLAWCCLPLTNCIRTKAYHPSLKYVWKYSELTLWLEKVMEYFTKSVASTISKYSQDLFCEAREKCAVTHIHISMPVMH